jgi:hypothetical protein
MTGRGRLVDASNYRATSREEKMDERIPTWPIFHRVWRRAALFEQMMDFLNIDLGAAARMDHGEAIRVAHRKCLECKLAQDCRNWIEASECQPRPPPYCFNIEFFSRCNREASRGASRNAGA